MREIGRIMLVQVQRSTLKIGRGEGKYYDPAPLLAVDGLEVSPDGVIGVLAGGDRIVDVHHTDHPATRNKHRKNGVSVGFASHYQAMRAQFGPHLADGCAGENVLVETERDWGLADLGQRLAIQSAATGQIAYLVDLLVAAPCVEFSNFAAGQGERLPAEALKATLQFLDHGRRGFYARLADEPRQVVVRAGDRVLLDEP
jgi:hypothetical protein